MSKLRERGASAQYEDTDTEWTPTEILAACRVDRTPVPLWLSAALGAAWTPVPRRTAPLLAAWKRGARRYAAAQTGEAVPDARPTLTVVRGGKIVRARRIGRSGGRRD